MHPSYEIALANQDDYLEIATFLNLRAKSFVQSGVRVIRNNGTIRINRIDMRRCARIYIIRHKSDGMIVGMGKVSLLDTGSRKARAQGLRPKGFLSWLFIDEDHRGHGLARALVEHRIEVMRHMFGCTTFQTEIEEGNVACRSLYGSLGFSPLAEDQETFQCVFPE